MNVAGSVGGIGQHLIRQDSNTSLASTQSSHSERELKAPELSEFKEIGLENKHDWSIEIGQGSEISNQAVSLIESRLDALGWSLEILDEQGNDETTNGYDSDNSFTLGQHQSPASAADRDASTEHCFCEIKTTLTLKYPEDETAQEQFYGALYETEPDASDADYVSLVDVTDKEVTQTKTVFAHPKAPLIDLLHEFDHVLQFEKEQQIQQETSEDYDDYDSVPYIFTKLEIQITDADGETTPWDDTVGLSDDGGFAKVFEHVEDRLDGRISSAFGGDVEQDTKMCLYDHLVPPELQARRLTQNQNNHAEVNAYERETERYEAVDFSDQETQEIRDRVKENEPSANLEPDEPLQLAFDFVKSQNL